MDQQAGASGCAVGSGRIPLRKTCMLQFRIDRSFSAEAQLHRYASIHNLQVGEIL